MLERMIPSGNEKIPVIGLGTWQKFDVGTLSALPPLTQVLEEMKHAGAKVIDSSPMYGRAEEIVGTLTAEPGMGDNFFYATKVWTEGRQQGIKQMEASFRKLKRKVIDLMQIHNLVDWEAHLQTLRQWKAEGRIRYIGITHYTGQMHEELERIISKEQIDFVQFNYSIFDRNAEQRLLPAAAARGVATLVNRPLGEGKLFAKVKAHALPDWAADYEITSWGQFFLKFIVSHPAVTCVIPGTGDPDHAADNMRAGIGTMPDEAGRNRMADFVAGL